MLNRITLRPSLGENFGRGHWDPRQEAFGAGDLEVPKVICRGPNPVSALVCEAAQFPCAGLLSMLWFPEAGHVGDSSLKSHSPFVSFSELFRPGGPLALSGIDGDPEGGLALGPMAQGQCLSARCPAPGALKFWPFLALWSLALSCVSSSRRAPWH
nr:uncharacterized protein LOC105499082 [Macaca nemestrina]